MVSPAWLVNRVAGLIYTVCTTQEKLTGRIKQTNYATDKPRERDRKRYQRCKTKPLIAGYAKVNGSYGNKNNNDDNRNK